VYPRPMKRYRWPLRGLLVAAAAGVLGLGLNYEVAAYTTANQRLIPELANAALYLALVPVAVVLYLVVGLFRGGRPTGSARREKLIHWALYLLTAVVSLGVALAMVVTRPNFLLGPSLVDRASSPDGTKTGYVYQTCFISAQLGVYVRAKGQVMLNRVETIARPTCNEGVRVHWLANGEPEVVDATGQRLVSVEPPQMHLNLGPR